MGSHLNTDGEFQSDKYPTCPAGKVPLSVRDASAQDLLWTYASRREVVDAEFSGDLREALIAAGYQPPARLDPDDAADPEDSGLDAADGTDSTRGASPVVAAAEHLRATAVELRAAVGELRRTGDGFLDSMSEVSLVTTVGASARVVISSRSSLAADLLWELSARILDDGAGRETGGAALAARLREALAAEGYAPDARVSANAGSVARRIELAVPEVSPGDSRSAEYADGYRDARSRALSAATEVGSAGFAELRRVTERSDYLTRHLARVCRSAGLTLDESPSESQVRAVADALSFSISRAISVAEIHCGVLPVGLASAVTMLAEQAESGEVTASRRQATRAKPGIKRAKKTKSPSGHRRRAGR